MNNPVSPTHVFICFSSKDEAVARNVVRHLEGRGLTCWISVRDVQPGENYQETIVRAVETAKGLIFLFSEDSSKSGEIKKELSLAGAANIPVFPLRLAPILPTGALRYELATRQWIDLFEDASQALNKLADTIRGTLGQSSPATIVSDPAPAIVLPPQPAPPIAAMPETGSEPAKKRIRKPRAPLMTADSQEFEAIRVLLARHVGPIARMLVQKAAADAKSLEEMCGQLAEHVSKPVDRATFLKAARDRLAIKS